MEVATHSPEAHFLGEIVGGEGFGRGSSCKWMIEAGEGWQPLGGEFVGQTQCDYPVDSGEMAVWCHPIDIHYSMTNVASWPRIVVQVWGLDEDSRLELKGYGFTHMPSVPGMHDLEIATWKPLGNTSEELKCKSAVATDLFLPEGKAPI